MYRNESYAQWHGCRNLVLQLAQVTKFCRVVPNICGSSVWHLLHVILLAPTILRLYLNFWVGWYSVVGIVTCYGLDGPGIESRWGWDFLHPSRPALGPPNLLYNGYQVFPGGNVARAWHWQPTPSSADVKETVKLYLYSPSGPSWPVLGWTLPLPLPYLQEWNNIS